MNMLRIAISALWLVFGIAAVKAQNTTFDRPYFEALVSTYLNALVSQDPTPLPTAPCVRYVENSQIIRLGQGEWRTKITLGKYRHIFSDPESKQVGAITTITENGVGAIYVLRLKVEDDGKISEIETQITRDVGGAALYENRAVPEAVWLEPVPVEKRVSRAKLVEQTNRYYTGMERNDPKGNYSFFAKDCDRLEDGLQTTNQKSGDPYGHSNDTAFASLGCEAQFQTGFLGFVTKIRGRRYPVVDEERQAVLAITIFDHNGTVRELPSVNGTSSPIPPYFDVPRTLAASEAFRLKGEKLHRIEMTLIEVPYGMRSAFEAGSPPDLRGAGNNITAPTPPNLANELETVLSLVLEGINKNDTSKLPLAKGVRYSENGQFLAIGDGLWETLQHYAKPGEDGYAARFSDASTGEAAYWGLTKEQTTPGVLALRTKVVQGKITEIEAHSVRAETTGSRGGTTTLMRPPLPIEYEGASLGALDPVFIKNNTEFQYKQSVLVDAYFDGLEKHSSVGVSFTPSCTRRDNGKQENATCAAQLDGEGSTPNGLFQVTGKVRDRRILVADASRGVVLVSAVVDYPAASNATLPATERIPSSYLVPQLIRIENGSISKIESMIKWVPLGYTSAWAEQNSGGVGNTTTGNCTKELF